LAEHPDVNTHGLASSARQPTISKSWALLAQISRLQSAPRRIFMFLRDLLIPSHLLVLLGLFLLFFGGKKLPEFGKGLGDGIRSFRNSVKTISTEPEQ
jgi:sec-independent protein translocase protein TatA